MVVSREAVLMKIGEKDMNLKEYSSMKNMASTPSDGAASKFNNESSSNNTEQSFNINDYLNDIPLLVDDLTDEDDELESKTSERTNYADRQDNIKYVSSASSSLVTEVSAEPTVKNEDDSSVGESGQSKLTSKEFKQERNQLMMVIVKYVSVKITNLFPPSSSESKISLEKFLIIMINRLKMSLSNFLKSLIYLFRYMDIIYLLRYLNQSNNYAHFNEMDFPLKKLIVGCFKLTLLKERIHKNWFKMTGLKDNEINIIIQTIMKRLNNKVAIKNNELTKFKSEIFRYVKMVSQEV